MQKTISLKLLPSEAANETRIKEYIAQSAAVKLYSVRGFTILKHSIDARGRQVWINLSVKAFIDEPFRQRELISFHFPDIRTASKQVIIIGAGPAGLFAALQLIEKGIKPILLERGKDVRARRRDLAILNKEGKINPESNYCFGEGGAGTYSDGKLYTRSSKRGDINRILNLFVHFGAEEQILYEAHPHIGTNKLPQKDNTINSVKTADGNSFKGDAFILATGHSARDIFELLHEKKILIEAKPFALGVRVEHPQSLIDTAQYHCAVRGEFLPPAAYSWVQQVDGKGVFSFCMCPGGLMVPAATSPGEIVLNGMSLSRRDSRYANSGTVVSVHPTDFDNSSDPFCTLNFQQSVEQNIFNAGDGSQKAPAQRLTDFMTGRVSASLPESSYIPGLWSAPVHDLLPKLIIEPLQSGIKIFAKKMKGYLTEEAVVVATESRTSSPIRIPRNSLSMHPQCIGLFPCGEGAGYAGGIVSAAMDGQHCAEAAFHYLTTN